jgi:hypothetical protein
MLDSATFPPLPYSCTPPLLRTHALMLRLHSAAVLPVSHVPCEAPHVPCAAAQPHTLPSRAARLPGEADAVQLAAIAIVESSGRMGSSQALAKERDTRIGICNVSRDCSSCAAAGCAARRRRGPVCLAWPQHACMHRPYAVLHACTCFMHLTAHVDHMYTAACILLDVPQQDV